MAKLVSMKISKGDRERQSEPSIAADRPAYPWGLSINLDDASLKKLGLDASDLAAGDTITLVAECEVSSISSNDSADGGKHQSVSLQITACCIEGEGDAAAAAKSLYA